MNRKKRIRRAADIFFLLDLAYQLADALDEGELADALSGVELLALEALYRAGGTRS